VCVVVVVVVVVVESRQDVCLPIPPLTKPSRTQHPAHTLRTRPAILPITWRGVHACACAQAWCEPYNSHEVTCNSSDSDDDACSSGGSGDESSAHAAGDTGSLSVPPRLARGGCACVRACACTRTFEI
jgi:hypothetical protein